MPALSSRPSEELLDEKENNIPTPSIATSSSAFTIISSDNITTFGKPNAIVRPLRRPDTLDKPSINNINNIELQIIPTSSYHNPNQSYNINQNNNSNNLIPHSQQNGILERNRNYNNNNSFDKPERMDFSNDLDLKLKKLQKDKITKNTQLPIIQQKRPIFITTVPKGVFLSPVRETPVPRRCYAYMSQPRILHNNKQKFFNDQVENLDGSTKTTPQLSSRLSFGFGKIASAGIAGLRLGRSLRETLSQTSYQNVMYDKRVIRGSNYSSSHINTWNPYFAYAGLLSGKGEGDCCTTREQEAQRRNQVRKKTLSQRNQRGIIGTPPPVKGRKHEPVQTDKYLEELFARPPEMDASCQTDLFLHRPPTPPFVPAKTGKDVETDIGEGDLFDFDTEVQPVLETLIGKAVEQGLIEVVHEEEICDMKEQQQRYLAIREAELAELRRLEQQEKRFQAEKELRIKQDKISKHLDRDMQERITAAKLLQGHIANLLPGVLNNIEAVTEADNREELEKQLGPWLAQEVAEEVGQMIDSRDLLEEIVREILRERAEMYIAMMNSESIASVEGMEEEGEDEEDTLGLDDELGKDL